MSYQWRATESPIASSYSYPTTLLGFPSKPFTTLVQTGVKIMPTVNYESCSDRNATMASESKFGNDVIG